MAMAHCTQAALKIAVTNGNWMQSAAACWLPVHRRGGKGAMPFLQGLLRAVASKE